MLRTAPNSSISANRVPAHSPRHQTSASFAGFLLKREQNSSLSCSSLLVVGKPCESITKYSTVPQHKDENVWLWFHGNAIKVHMYLAYQFITVIIESWQGQEQNWAFLTALKLCWCPKLCAGTLFVLLLKFGAVLSIICGYEGLLNGGFLVEA